MSLSRWSSSTRVTQLPARDRPVPASPTPGGPTRGGRVPEARVPEEARSETNVSAEQSPTGKASRFPTPDVDARRAARVALPPPQGPPPAVGLIWRVRDRAAFAELQRRGRRQRRGPVTVTFLAEAAPEAQTEPPKVAFAVGRQVGPAVRRNRVRRQLRSIMRELVARPDTPVGPGTYLVSARPEVTALSYQELKSTVETALEQIRATQRTAGEGQK
jgi:ribonuclease P protein component